MKNTPKPGSRPSKSNGTGANRKPSGACVEMLRAFKARQDSGAKLNGHALAVGMALADSMWPVGDRYEGDPGIKALMDRTRWTKPTVRKALAALEAAGVVHHQRQSMRIAGKTRRAEDRWILDPQRVAARVSGSPDDPSVTERQGNDVALAPLPVAECQGNDVSPSGQPRFPPTPACSCLSTNTGVDEDPTEGAGQEEVVQGVELQPVGSDTTGPSDGLVKHPVHSKQDATEAVDERNGSTLLPGSARVSPAGPAPDLAPLLVAAGFTGQRLFLPWLKGAKGRAVVAGLVERVGLEAVEGALRDIAQATPRTKAAKRVRELLRSGNDWLTSRSLVTLAQSSFNGQPLLEAAAMEWKSSQPKPEPKRETWAERLALDRIRQLEFDAEFQTGEEQARARAELARITGAA